MNTETDPQAITFNYPDSLVTLLAQSKITLLASTYQSEKLMILGHYQGHLDLRYHDFPRPMGITARDNQIWAGMGHGIWQFQNLASAASAVDKKKQYTACYLPMNLHLTGDIDIHEMAFSDRLYFINTRFSCLCVMDEKTSFTPLWKPPFITDLQPVDKCHLNGLALRDKRPRYVTLLGETDQPLGWRARKEDGGMIMDIATNQVLARGLSMPHSPRWHKGCLWFLESGKGALCRISPETGKVCQVCRVPGFTRGLRLIDDVAFVGVSKVRESATFSGLPVTRLTRRTCGVWVVDLNTGRELTYIEFPSGVDEIFSVEVLPHTVTEISDFQSQLSRSNYLVPKTCIAEVSIPKTPVALAAPHFERGNDLFNAGKKKQAIGHFQKALDIQPDFLPACFNMAIALGDLKQFDQAETMLLKIVEKDAAIVETYNSLGYVYYKKGELKKARAQFEKALDLKPDYAQAKTSLEIIKKEMPPSP